MPVKESCRNKEELKEGMEQDVIEELHCRNKEELKVKKNSTRFEMTSRNKEELKDPKRKYSGVNPKSK